MLYYYEILVRSDGRDRVVRRVPTRRAANRLIAKLIRADLVSSGAIRYERRRGLHPWSVALLCGRLIYRRCLCPSYGCAWVWRWCCSRSQSAFRHPAGAGSPAAATTGDSVAEQTAAPAITSTVCSSADDGGRAAVVLRMGSILMLAIRSGVQRSTIGRKSVKVGAAVSITIFLFSPSEPAAPGAASVRMASLAIASLIVPPFKASAVVLV